MYDTADSISIIPIPTTLSSRIVISIYSLHYPYFSEQSKTNSVKIENMIVAWDRIVNRLLGNQINLIKRLDLLLSLGSFFEID